MDLLNKQNRLQYMKKIAFLRGINVGGKRKLAMNDLLQLCRDIGWQNPSSYIQSGNLMFESKQDNHLLEAALEQLHPSLWAFAP